MTEQLTTRNPVDEGNSSPSPSGAARAARGRRRRSALVLAASVLVLIVLMVATMSLGRLGLDLDDWGKVFDGTASGKTSFVLERLRGPRLLVALGAGMALAQAGLLFQQALRNPLASPDVMGITAGAGAGTVISVHLLTFIPAGIGSAAGAVLAAGIAWLSTGRGFNAIGRLIVAGIAIAAASLAVIHFVVAVTLRDKAMGLVALVSGSLNSRDPAQGLFIGICVLVGIPLSMLVMRRLRVLELGDDLATGLGSRPSVTRTAAIGLGVAWCAAAVAVAGPVAFIALASPQIARGLVGRDRLLPMTIVTGALLLIGADLLVQQAPMFDGLSVGVITGFLGGLYLAGVLLVQWRRGTLA